MALTFTEAKNHEIPFGVWKGRRIDSAAETDEGLVYLAWLMNALKTDRTLAKMENKRELAAALKTYFADKTIARELKAARRSLKSNGKAAD